jgi:hypothetical protein
MKVQRSIGRKILAVVAGIGIAASGIAAIAPSATAQEEGFVLEQYWQGTGPDETIVQNMTQEKLAECNANPDFTGCTAKNGYVGVPPEAPTQQFRTGTVEGCNLRAYTCTEDEGNDTPGELFEEALDPAPAPPPCWNPSINNCPVGGAIQVAVPQYMIAGVPQQLVVYAAWRPDENTSGAPTNGDAVISMDGEPIAAAAFADGKATFNFTPTEPGLKEVVVSGVLNSNTSGANAWIDSVDASTMVLPYDPESLETALKNKKVEVGDTYTLEEVAQAKTALGKRLEWRVAQDSKDVCAVTTTNKGEVRAKFTESGKCSIIWTDPKKDEEGKYTFKVTA